MYNSDKKVIMEISEKTTIPLFAVLAAVGFFATVFTGAIVWLTTVASDAAAAKAEVTGLRPLVIDVRERLIRVETSINKK